MLTPITSKYFNVSELPSDRGDNMKDRREDFESQSKRALKYLSNIEDLVSYKTYSF